MSTTSDFERAQKAVFDEVGITPVSRFVDIDELPATIQVIENSGEDWDDVPVLFLHSGGTFGAIYAPLMAHLDETRTLAIDRPGFGLSDRFEYSPATYRETVIDALTGILDTMGVEQVDLVGNSNGGYWSVVYALSRPDRVRRLALLGSLPAFPGTSPPIPLRLYTIPILNQYLGGMFLAANEDDVIDKFDIFGEREIIQQYPALIDAIVARDRQPHAHDLDISEMNSLLTIRGWRSSNRLRETELCELQQPTLVIWGEDDPLGDPEDVRGTVERIPDGRLEALDTGHIPWLGYPEKCAKLIEEMRQ